MNRRGFLSGLLGSTLVVPSTRTIIDMGRNAHRSAEDIVREMEQLIAEADSVYRQLGYDPGSLSIVWQTESGEIIDISAGALHGDEIYSGPFLDHA